VKTLWTKCFLGCESLSTVTFESGCEVSCIGESVFGCCSSLSSIWIPAHVQAIFHEYEGLLKVIEPSVRADVNEEGSVVDDA
jgi:hypothetical protein